MKAIKDLHEGNALPSGIYESFFGKTQCSVCSFEACKYNKDVLILND